MSIRAKKHRANTQRGLRTNGVTAGRARMSKAPKRLKVHKGAKNGEVIALASGAIREICENQAADKGKVMILDAKVSASASRKTRGSFGQKRRSHSPKSDENSRIPKVEPADKAKETESAVKGSQAIKQTMHSAKAFKA